jgi:hypothetical protein
MKEAFIAGNTQTPDFRMEINTIIENNTDFL